MNGGAELVEGGAFFGVEGVGGVVAAFGVDVGLGGAEEVGGASFGEDADGADAGEGSKDFGAVGFGIDGAGGAFEAADGGIVIEADEEEVAEGAGGLEVADVAGVEEVEAAVGGDEAGVGRELITPEGELVESEDGGGHVGRVVGGNGRGCKGRKGLTGAGMLSKFLSILPS